MDEDARTSFEGKVFEWVDKMQIELAFARTKFALPSEDNGELSTEAQEIKKSLSESTEILKRADVRQILCPPLQSLRDDAKDIAKIVTAAMLPLAMVGSVPLSPVIFAGLAVIIARMGISAICPK